MANNLPKKAQSNQDFNPTIPDHVGPAADDADHHIDLSASFAHIPTSSELSIVARESFPGLPEELIRRIIQESEEVAHSTRKILQEHMRIGSNFAHILAGVEAHYVATQGDTEPVRNLARKLVYAYLMKAYRKSKSSIRLYIRCYEKFSTNIGAVEMLSYSDMALLVGNDIRNDTVEAVIAAKQDNTDLSKADVKKLIADLQDKLSAKDNNIEAVTTELTTAVAQLDLAQGDLARVTKALESERLDRAREKENAQHVSVELASVSQQVSVLQLELANKEAEVDQLTRKIHDVEANPQKEKVPVPTVPEPYTDLASALTAKLGQLNETKAELDDTEAKLAALKEKLASHEAEIQAGQVLEQKIHGLIEKFGAFVQEYHSAQLLATADGKPTRFQPLFQALADLTGKFHGEIVAATRAA